MTSVALSTLDAAEQLIAQLGNPEISARYEQWRSTAAAAAASSSPANTPPAPARRRVWGETAQRRGTAPGGGGASVLADVSNVKFGGAGGAGGLDGLNPCSTGPHQGSSFSMHHAMAREAVRHEGALDVSAALSGISRQETPVSRHGRLGRVAVGGDSVGPIWWGTSVVSDAGETSCNNLNWNGADEHETIVEEIDKICRSIPSRPLCRMPNPPPCPLRQRGDWNCQSTITPSPSHGNRPMALKLSIGRKDGNACPP